MAPTFAPGYVKPGFYVKQRDISTPQVSAGIRLGAIIGQGAKTSTRLDNLVKGAKNGTDGPLANNIVIQIQSLVDVNNVVYTPGVDFLLTRPTPTTAVVDWSPKASITGAVDLSTYGDPQTLLNGQTLNLAIDGVYPPAGPVLFSPPFSTNNAAGIVAFINSWDPLLAGVASLNAGNQLVLSSNSVLVDNGTANSNLGLVTGKSAAVREPATGTKYQVTYTSDKLPNEYTKNLYADVNDIITDRGPLRQQVSLDAGNVTAAGTGVLSNAGAAWVVNAFIGNYVKITSGPGKGQVRVIIANTATQLTLSQDWNAGNVPNATSGYNITDINDDSITMGAKCFLDAGAANGGSTFVICTQYPDDIFNPANIQGAVDDLQTDIAGQRPYSLVLMQGIGVSDQDPIVYVNTHCQTMSNVYNNKWRQCVFGAAQNTDSFLDFITMASGIRSDRLVIVNISDVVKDFGQGPVNLDGSYLAAAHAGIICANVDSGEPITRKKVGTVFSVDAFADPFLENEKDLMAAQGITIYERQGSDIACRHALNTAIATILVQETKLTRSKDDISDYLKSNLEDSLTGQRFTIDPATGTSDIAGNAEAQINFLLTAKQNPANQVITSFANVSAVQDPTEKRQLDITADIYLTTDLLWEYALLGFGV